MASSLDHPGGVVGRAEERDGRRRLGEDAPHLVEVEGEVVGALADGDAGAGDAGDVAVQRVGGLEHGRRAAGAAVGEAQRLEHLVGAVGGEDLLGRRRRGGRRWPRAGRGSDAVGVAVPLERGQLGGERVGEAGRRRLGRLVGVEADGHVDLGRVVALHEREVVARRDGHDGPCRQADRLGVGVEALVGGQRDRRAAPTSASAAWSTRHDVDVLEEVVDPQRAGEAGRAVGGQHVVGPGEVVAHRRRRVRAAEHGAGVAHERAAARRGRPTSSSRCSGAMALATSMACSGPSHEHGVAALGERGLEVRPAGRARRRSRRPPSATPSATASSQVMSQARPSGPCSACSTTSMAAQLDRRGGVGDHHDLGRAGERATARRPARPTRPRAWPARRRRCRGRR